MAGFLAGFKRAIGLGGLLLLGGCGSIPGLVRPGPGLGLSLDPTGLTLVPGGSGTSALTLVAQNGFQGQVALSAALPSGSGLTLDFLQEGRPVSQVSLPAGGQVQVMVRVQAAPEAAAGAYALVLQAQGQGVAQKATLGVQVQRPAGEFSLSLEAQSLWTTPGGEVSVRLVVGGTGPGQVSLSLLDQAGRPFSGVSLDPTQVSVPSAPVLTLRAQPGLPPGVYPLRLRGVLGGTVREVPFTLEVRTPTAATLAVQKTEWGQTVLKENLRLVEGKEALLRVHLVAPGGPVSATAPLVGRAYRNTTLLGELSFACPNPIPTTTQALDLSTTCNATLPGDWVRPGLKVELRPQGGNPVVLTPEVGSGTLLPLTLVPVVHGGQTAAIPDFARTLWRVWPIQGVSQTTRAAYVFGGTLAPGDASAWGRLLDELRILRAQDGSGRYYYGFVRVNYTSGIAGIGYIGYPVAVGWDYPQSAPQVMAHELGHTFGREHAPCGTSGDPGYPYPGGRIGTPGYDLANRVLIPPDRYDLMSYCGPQWVSDYTYQGAQGFLEANPPKPLGLPQGLLVSGRIREGQAAFYPPLRVEGVRLEGEVSPYRLEADGQTYPVQLLRDSEGGLAFQALLPLAAYARLTLYEGGRALGRLEAPLTPLGLEGVELKEEGGILRLRWPEGQALSLAHLAPDGTRTPLTLWNTAGRLDYPAYLLPPGGAFEVQLAQGTQALRRLFPR